MTYIAFVVLKFIYYKLCAPIDLMKGMCLGSDYWAPFPTWEWNDPPLLWNVCDYCHETRSWDGLYPNMMKDEKVNKKMTREGKEEEKHVQEDIGDILEEAFDINTTIVSSSSTSSSLLSSLSPTAASTQYYSHDEKEDVLTQNNSIIHTHDKYDHPAATTTTLTTTCSLNDYEQEYLTMTKAKNEPTVVICICYLLMKEKNDFLLESLDFFTKVHKKTPIYVMMNTREEGSKEGASTCDDGGDDNNTSSWVKEQLDNISISIKEKYTNPSQIRTFYIDSSKSKAGNLNAFIDILQCKGYEDYKYVLNYDVDDRPTFNETSLIAYAENVVGSTISGQKIVGLQGPCLECFNDTLSGLLEAKYEFNVQTGLLAMYSRFGLRVKSQGSNNLILSDVYRRYRFNTSVLLEDWRFSNDLCQEKIGFKYVRTMICFGQTPYGWNAIMRRRDRWFKGGWNEMFYDAFQRSPFTPVLKEWFKGWRTMFQFIVLMPTLHMLILLGFGVIFRETSASLSNFGMVNLEDFTETTGMPKSIGELWNVTFVSGCGSMLVISTVHNIRAITNMHSSCFLNGRNTLKYRVFYFFCYVTDLLGFFISFLTRYYQYQYYCLMESIFEYALRKETEWIPTEKQTQEEVTVNVP